MPRKPEPRRACIALADWPAPDHAAWQQAIAGRMRALGAYSYARRVKMSSIEKAREGYGRWLGFLRHVGQLDAFASLSQRLTPERLNDYLYELIALDNADHSITGRFQELQSALRIMEPRGDHGWITRPGGVSLRSLLPMKSRHLTLHHPADLFLWGLELMQSADDRSGPKRRQVQLRDGLLICVEALRGLRLRTVHSLELGRSILRDPDTGLWHLDIPPEDVKNERYIATALIRILTPWLDRYVAVERQELLQGKASTAFWINWGGQQLGKVGIDKRIRWWSTKRFGADHAFGTHRFRHCIGSTTPLLLPNHPALAATLLQISQGVLQKNYDRSNDIEAFRQFHAAIDAQRKKLAPRAPNLFDKQDS